MDQKVGHIVSGSSHLLHSRAEGAHLFVAGAAEPVSSSIGEVKSAFRKTRGLLFNLYQLYFLLKIPVQPYVLELLTPKRAPTILLCVRLLI